MRKPKFSADSKLVRYIDPDEIKRKGRISSAAFMPNPGETHLSVNSMETESLAEIADYYRHAFADGDKVDAAERTVADFNKAATKAGLNICYDQVKQRWEWHEETAHATEAYKHRPVPARPPLPASPSHCGVEFIQSKLDEITLRKIAEFLTIQKPRLHRKI